MVAPLRLLKFLVVIGIAYLAAASGAQQIYYTGKLFGYYRIEQGKPPQLDPVTAFLKWRESAPDDLLLGMGDNFGPEFGASIQFPGLANDCVTAPSATPSPHNEFPRDLYKSDSRLPSRIDCDNVTNFLRAAHYRAVVPGREDFIYSSLWVRTIAKLMRGQPDNNHPISMLAANLRLTATQADGPANEAKLPCGLLFASYEPLGTAAPMCTANGSATEAADWVDRLDQVVTGSIQYAVRSLLQAGKKSDSSFDPDSIRTTIVRNQLLIMQSAWGPETEKDFGKNAIATLKDWHSVSDFFANALNSGISRTCGVRQIHPDGRQLYWCDLLAKYQTFTKTAADDRHAGDLLISAESATEAQHQLLLLIDREMREVGYTVAEQTTGDVLIVGVVGKETMSAVSSANLTVCYEKPTNKVVSCPLMGRNMATVTVLDPVSTVVTAIRAAVAQHGQPFSRVIVMAQMPSPEAQILAARVRKRLLQTSTDQPRLPVQVVDLMISEAQAEYESAKVTLQDVDPKSMTPVFTPRAPGFTGSNPVMSGSVEHLTITGSVSKYEIKNEPLSDIPFESQRNSDGSPLTAASELMRRLPRGAVNWVPCAKPATGRPWTPLDCRYQGIIAILGALQRVNRGSDVVLLQRRDVYLSDLPVGYDGTQDDQYCPNVAGNAEADCLLRVALDRVLWKGDLIEHVAVTGSDLGKLLDTSSAAALGENDLKVTDLSQQWLISFGITQSELSNLSLLSMNGEPNWIPGDSECKQADQSKTGKTLYCVNGRPIVADEVYWIATSDGLAQDRILYTQLGAATAHARKPSTEFLTEVAATSLKDFGDRHEPFPNDARAISFLGAELQQQPLLLIDYNKLVLSFSNSHSLGPTDQVPAALQGVADSRAAVPHTQDTDLEATLRLTRDHVWFRSVSLGTLTSFTYERSIKGSLTGSPETVSYPQNLATFGAFAQFTLRKGYGTRSRSVPRDLIVITPHQLQTQVNNARVFIAYTAKDSTGQAIPGQLAIPIPLVNSFNDKVGDRYEWGKRPDKSWKVDGGSYAEGGFELSLQNNILTSITLANGAQEHTCVPAANLDIGTCFKNLKNSFPIGPGTTIVGSPGSATLHTPGAYWDVHLSRKLDTGVFKNWKNPLTLVSDSVGDVYFGRPASAVLPTQTNFAVSWSSSLNVPVWGNLNFAPTYNAFFYRPQLSNTYEQIRAFAISLRWYLGRNERVPIPEQVQFAGPASADQTKQAGRSK